MKKSDVRKRLDRIAGSVVDRELDDIRYALGALEARLAKLSSPPASLQEVEFHVFSQFGEDGSLQYLVNKLRGIPEIFVEVGVQDYRESNTRFLAMHNNWRGLAIDGGTAHVDFIHGGETGWRWAIDPVTAFVTAENVNSVITGHGVSGEIGILSIDVDGMDYWIWKAATAVAPWIVVVEFNSYFGNEATVTVPYQPDFDASSAHFSWVYQGASLSAMHHLGRERGYRLVGISSNGLNAFFVRDDVAGDLWDLSPQDAYIATRIRTARDATGRLTYVGDHLAVLATMGSQPLLDVVSGETCTVGAKFNV